MFDYSNTVSAVASVVIASIMAATIIFLIIRLTKKDSNRDFYINKNGFAVKSSVNMKELTPRRFVECMSEVIVYIEEAKENYVDAVLGIKRRIFKQSKDFAEASIIAVKNQIIEEYKVAYMEKYTGRTHGTQGDWINARNPTAAQLDESINDGSPKVSNPCDPICKGYCNSGLYYFDSKITKDFMPILARVNEIIEENHLINRNDREFEEEIASTAQELSSELKNKVLSYPIPIDNIIAKHILDKQAPQLKDTIADSLRRSRTLSGAKREWIREEQEKYLTNRNAQLSRIITIMGQDELNAILNSTATSNTTMIDKTADNHPDRPKNK